MKIIHLIDTKEFEALSPSDRIGYMADVAVETVGAGEDGSDAIAETYFPLFQRRMRQLYKLNDLRPSEAYDAVMSRARDLAETGEMAFAHNLDTFDDGRSDGEPDPDPAWEALVAQIRFEKDWDAAIAEDDEHECVAFADSLPEAAEESVEASEPVPDYSGAIVDYFANLGHPAALALIDSSEVVS